MKLVVGLGNPGRKYDGTRHNVGYVVVDELIRKFASGKPKSIFQASVVEASLGGERSLLIKPETFMNLSGASVLAARDFYKIPNDNILTVCDDFNLPLGKLRVRKSGSAGGQKGLADIIRRLGGEETPRLRVGVGAPPEGQDGAQYVLGKFRKDELPEIEQAIWTAADAVCVWATDGIEACMNRFN